MGHQIIIFGAIIEPKLKLDIDIADRNNSILNNLESIDRKLCGVFRPSVITTAENSEPREGFNVEYVDRIHHFGASYKGSGSYSPPDDYFVELFEKLLDNLYWTEAHLNQAEVDNGWYRRFLYIRKSLRDQVKVGKYPYQIPWKREMTHDSRDWSD